MSVVLQHRPGGVAVIRLDAPLTAADAGRLTVMAGELAENRDLRAVVMESQEEDFCPPADDLLTAESASPADPIAALPCPVIAVLHGRVRSAGLELALAADLRIAGPGTVLAMGDVLQQGRLPRWGGTQRLPRIAGRSLATRMLLLGDVVAVDEALAAGLVDEVADDPGARVEEVLAELGRRAPLALAYAKEAILRGPEMPMRSAILLEADLNLLLRSSRDRAEGLDAFFGKRPPGFSGE